jgi:hypothetical protein
MARRHPRRRHKIDGRTRVAKRARELVSAYVEELNRPTDALALEAVNRAATLTAQAEDARVRYAGGDLELAELVALENLARRARLEVQRAAQVRPRTSALAQHLTNLSRIDAGANQVISPSAESAAPLVNPDNATGPKSDNLPSTLELAFLEISDEPAQAEGESRQTFLLRIFDAFDALPDEQADKLEGAGTGAQAWYDQARQAAESGAPLPDFTEFAAQGQISHTPPEPVTDALEAELLTFLGVDRQRDGETRQTYLGRVDAAAQKTRITPRWDHAGPLITKWYQLANKTREAGQPLPEF